MKRIYTILMIGIVLSFGLRAQAQCGAQNTAFQSGETLMYDLYFNWKFVWVKVGTAFMNVTETTWKGRPAYRSYLATRGNKTADRLFVLRDTLTTYVDMNLVPLHFSKQSHEGKEVYSEMVDYSYPQGRCRVDMRYDRQQTGTHRTKTYESTQCAFDMISMMLRARSFDPTGWKKGHRVRFMMATGRHCEPEYLEYRGKETFTVESTGARYRCLVFSAIEPQKNGKEREVVRFYVTDDKNHLPVRLDLNLTFGSAKAFFVSGKGIRNPQEARIK